MLTRLIASKTILGFALTYSLCIAMFVFQVLFGQPANGISELVYTHWALAWAEQTPALLSIISIVLVAGTAILSRIRFRETSSELANTNLGMIGMVAIVASQPISLFTRLDISATAFLLVSVFLILYYTYKRESVLSEIFHIGLLVGISAFLVGQSVFMLLAVVFALLILRSGNIKEWLALGLGLIMMLVFLALFLVWHQDPLVSFQLMVKSAWMGNVSVQRLTASHICIVLVFLFSVTGLLSDLTTNTVHARNVALTNIGWLFGVVLMTLFFGLGWQNGLVLAAFPLSMFIGRAIEAIDRWWLADILLVTLIAAPFLSNLWRL
jgi:hypothetical protein